MKSTVPGLVNGVHLFGGVCSGVLSGVPPVDDPLGLGELGTIDFGPSRLLLVGGAPGAGKTAFAVQGLFDMLQLRPNLRAAVCNVEVLPQALIERQLSRVSRVPPSLITRRTLGEKQRAAFVSGSEGLRPLSDRVTFVKPPSRMENIRETAGRVNADVRLVDHVQRIAPGDGSRPASDKRAAVDAVVSELRVCGSAGLAVMAIAAVGRSKDTKGRNSYDGLTLGSFRESSELEFGCDDADTLTPGDPAALRHFQSRHGKTADIYLEFDKAIQQFRPLTSAPVPDTKPARKTRAKTAENAEKISRFDWRGALQSAGAAPADGTP